MTFSIANLIDKWVRDAQGPNNSAVIPYCHTTERTKHRPIADGRVSVQGALVFLAMHLVLLLALLWPLNTLAYVRRLWVSLS